MTDKVTVEFSIADGKHDQFIADLQAFTGLMDYIQGYRADDQVARRQALARFVDQMELKLRKNDHKKNWREKPLQALIALMLLEVEEFKVAYEHFAVEEARPELVDIANFAMIVWDRLSMLEPTINAKPQIEVQEPIRLERVK